MLVFMGVLTLLLFRVENYFSIKLRKELMSSNRRWERERKSFQQTFLKCQLTISGDDIVKIIILSDSKPTAAYPKLGLTVSETPIAVYQNRRLDKTPIERGIYGMKIKISK